MCFSLGLIIILLLVASGHHLVHGSRVTIDQERQQENSGDQLNDLDGLRLLANNGSSPSSTNSSSGHHHILIATNATFNFSDGSYLGDECRVNQDTRVDDLDDENCKAIKFFNQTALNSMDPEDMIGLVSYCACQLANMDHKWAESYDDTSSTRRVATIVNRLLNKPGDDLMMVTRTIKQPTSSPGSIRMDNSSSKNNNNSSPNYLWTDIDVTLYEISIYTATQDYFHQQVHNKSLAMSSKLRRELDHNQTWRLIWDVCRKIVRDPNNLYRYMENINRASPPVFFNLLQISEDIATVYDASKACKLPLMLHFENYKLKASQSSDRFLNPSNYLPASSNGGDPTSSNLAPTQPTPDSAMTNANTNAINTNGNDIDLMLTNREGASVLLLNCDRWRQNRQESSPPTREVNATLELARDCPMMVSDLGPADWIKEHPSPFERSMASIRCGCQLIGHNDTWHRMMQDHNVQVMSKALTNYMNRNQVPDFTSTPIWSLFGWFESIMIRFVKNRKPTLKEVVKTLSGDQDPLEMKSGQDLSLALELCRRACNFIMFNYNKGASSREQQIELKSIKYLDNLQLISQDTMFVFHLTLQDSNLFKIYALSRMCLPFVS